jgi:DNA-binding XRE family transcriptional regulator
MPDHDDLIGPSAFPQVEQTVPRTAIAFGALVRLDRRSCKLTVAGLAKALDVEEVEIRNIEHDPAYRARPRTILRIAQHFKLPKILWFMSMDS